MTIAVTVTAVTQSVDALAAESAVLAAALAEVEATEAAATCWPGSLIGVTEAKSVERPNAALKAEVS